MSKKTFSKSSACRRHTRGNSTSNQGARSKMDQKTAFNKNSDKQGLFPCPLAKDITVLWDSVTFCFMERNQASRGVQKSLRLDIGKVMFALTSDRKENSFKILKENGVEVNVNDTHQIEVKFIKQLKVSNEKLQYLENIFEEHIICDLDSVVLDPESPEGSTIIKEMKRNTVEVYRCGATNVLYVVGEKSKVKQMSLKENPDLSRPKSKKRTQPFKKDLSLDDSFLLGFLGFEDHIASCFKGAEVHVTQNPPICLIDDNDCPNINIENEISHFLNKVKRKTLQLSGELIQRLFFDQYPHPNCSFYSFIRKKLQTPGRKVAFYISMSDTGKFVVNCSKENDAQKVADIVKKSIVSETVKVNWGKDGWSFLKEWSGKKKLFYNKISPEQIELCCTSDVHIEFHKIKMQNVNQSASLSLPDSQLRFLRSFGKDILLGLEKQFGFRATVKESELELTGKPENLQKSEDFLKSELRKHRKAMPLDVPIECIENKKDEIDTAMNKGECVWDLKTVKKPVKMLKNCDYLASWIDPVREMKVTVVDGVSWHIDLDLHIVMTNQSLYPMEFAQSQFKDMSVIKGFIPRGINILERKGGKVDVGEYTELLKEMSGCENFYCVALVVCSDFNSETYEGLDIKQKIKEILTQHVSSNITNFGINASEEGGAKNLTRQAIEAALEFADARPGRIDEIFICCQTAPTQELRKVHELIKEKRGFVQNIYSDSAQILKHTDSDTTIEVVEGSLEKLEADIMVNTTNSFLKLNEGSVSSTILKMAGPYIQKECKSNYPGGLKKGQVAKTKAYKLKNWKFVYHISLPDYNVTTFREDVKTYVKKCLCQAERDKCCRIVFPALGVGRLKYPRRETAEAMFDAAEEYCLEVINPVLKSIKFLVNVKDAMTYEAFRDEEYRRSKRCVKEIGPTQSLIKKDFKSLVFKTDQNHPSIKITSLQDFGVPPAYAIEVFIGHVKAEEIYRKRAFDEPPSWNDRWFLQRADSMNKLTEGLSKFWNKLAELDDRVTEIVIYTNKDSMCNIFEEDQARSICYFFSMKKSDFLQEVIIVVSDEPILQRTKKLFKDGELVIDRENDFSRSTELSIELIGKTNECINAGETFITDLVQKIKQENITYVVSRLPSSKNDFEVFNEVTAKINPGIMNFKKQKNEWDAWVTNVEKIFRLKVDASSEDEVMVRGDFSCVLRFEDYLDKGFPNNPSAIDDS